MTTLTFCTDINGQQMMNPSDFGATLRLTFMVFSEISPQMNEWIAVILSSYIHISFKIKCNDLSDPFNVSSSAIIRLKFN